MSRSREPILSSLAAATGSSRAGKGLRGPEACWEGSCPVGTPPGKTISSLGVARAEGAAWREDTGEGRRHHPPWPLSQAPHSSRIFYDSDPMGIPLVGEAANPRPSEWERPPPGTEGEQGAFMEQHRGENVSFGGSRPDSHSGSDTSCVTLSELMNLSGPQCSYL